MSYAMDIFELSVDVIFRCCGWRLSEKYFPFELDIMVGTIIKMISFIASFTFLDIYNFWVLSAYFYFWTFQASFIIFEYIYIFEGQSKTKERQFKLKQLSLVQSCYGFIIYKVMNDRNDTATLVFLYIIFGLAIIDVLELIIFFVRLKMNRLVIEDYESPGFSYEFLTFRMIGGIIGFIVLLIVYIVFLLKVGYDTLFYQFIPFLMFLSEIINLVITQLQINKKRKKEKLIVDDRGLNKLKLKKRYCIIMGFLFGLVGVITSCALQLSYIVFKLLSWIFCYQCCNKTWKSAQQRISRLIMMLEIIDYEIYHLNQVQEDLINTQT